MSDTREDAGSIGRLAIRGAQLEPVRERMRSFVADRERPDLKELRRSAAQERSLSELVEEDRRERLD